MNIQRRPLEQDPLSNKSTDKIKEWLSNCHSLHEDCRSKRTTNRLPTRLISVGGKFDGDEPYLTTPSTDPDGDRIQYVALSHCWGRGAPPLKTESCSLSERTRSIPLDILPATYRDAVLLTRSLGLKYIWIDSLCIIQDDKDDWERESATMFHVYQNAYVTLCALVDSCYQGLFQERNAPGIEIKLRSSTDSTVHGAYFLRKNWAARGPLSYGTDAEREPPWYDMLISKWNTRGWTFQEAEFSTRKLICCKRLIYYDCATTFCSEDEFWQQESYSGDTIGALSEADIDGCYQTWYQKLALYSNRSFTFYDDRLPAVSSLAAVIAARTGDEYIAGLWRHDLHNGLLWHRGYPIPAPRSLRKLLDDLDDAQHFVAPSWSWACRQDPVEWDWLPKLRDTWECQIFEADAEVDGLNPYGRIKAAHLKVFGKLCKVHELTLSELVQAGYWMAKTSNQFFAIFRLDWTPTEKMTDRKITVSWEDSGIAMLLLATCTAADEDASMNDEGFKEYCSGLWESVECPWEQQCGLLLHPTGKRNEYYRIGVFQTLDWEKGGRQLFQEFPTQEIRLI